MDSSDPKQVLHRYLDDARDAIVWKLEGLSEYDVRRPMTPTGTNLLGLVKHLASIELGYFGDTFDRPSGIALPWFEPDAEANADMWATVDESRAEILALYEKARALADQTIEALPLDAPGRVPWWSDEHASTTLHHILVHMIAETERHAGQADIVREEIDGSVGVSARNSNLPTESRDWWASYRERLEAVARQAHEQENQGTA
jgi:uncharacterized damage-inducible protein DinB